MIKVKFEYEFYFDDSELDENFVDIEGLAKDCAMIEMLQNFNDKYLTADDFEIEEDEENEYND